MAYAHDGRRLNVKMSDMRTTTGHLGVNFRMSNMYTVKHASYSINYGGTDFTTGVVKNRSDASGYRVSGSNRLDLSSGVTTHTDAAPVIHKSSTGRYRTGTGAPSIITLPTRTADNDNSPNVAGSNVKFGDFVGINNIIFPTDQCGWTSANTSNYYADGGFDLGIARTRDTYYYSGNTRIEGGTNTNAYGPGQGFTNKGRFEVQGNKGYGVTEDNLAWTVATTRHNNQWREIALNTIAGPGDRVVVVAQSWGGTMYTFTNPGPIYLRTATGGTISGVSTYTHYGPTKNSTANDTWVAVYSALLGNTGGAAYVGVNPYHSSTQNYIFHCFVLKKGYSATPGIMGVRREKHGGVSNGSGYSGSTQSFDPANGLGSSAYRASFITIATSPGMGSGTSSNGIAPTSTSNYDLAFCGHGLNGFYQSGTSNSRYNGEWSVTVNNYTGGVNHVLGGKFNVNTTYGNGTSNTYMPGHGSDNMKGTFKALVNDYDVIMLTVFQ